MNILNDLDTKKLESLFLQYRNDIDIYTEDNPTDKEFYIVLLNKVLKDTGISFNDIFPIGTRSNVITKCLEDKNSKRISIYIVDGDIEIVHQNFKNESDKLVILDSYCIENYIIDEDSVCEFLYLQCAKFSKPEIKNKLDFDNWIKLNLTCLIELYAHLAILDLNKMPFTLNRIGKYIPSNDCEVSKELVEKEISTLKNIILKKITFEQYTEQFALIMSKWNPSVSSLLTVLSGKDYLLPFIIYKSNQLKGTTSRLGQNEIKFLLANLTKAERLKYLKDRILKICSRSEG